MEGINALKNTVYLFDGKRFYKPGEKIDAGKIYLQLSPNGFVMGDGTVISIGREGKESNDIES